MKHWLLLFGYSLWEFWLGKTKKLVANSSWALLLCLIGRLFRKGKQMTPIDQDVKLGDVGDLDIKLAGGKATLTVKAAVPGAALTVGVVAEMDAIVLIDKLKGAIEAKYPASMPVDEAVFALLKSAVSSA